MTTHTLHTPAERTTRAAPAGEGAATAGASAFEAAFRAMFDGYFTRIFRYLDRMTGDPDAAADAAQEAFVRLYGRGVMPERPSAWLVTVALNQMRNALAQRTRRAELLTVERGRLVHSEPPDGPADLVEREDERRRVRRALDLLSERDRSLVLLRAEGYSYRELAEALHLHEASIGTQLARARARFRDACEEPTNAR
ncbi:MAG TPA: sigma-70 family RNA polymerase sigma factor [Gemmatimonadaceae bacterium]|nr:sigma-70 family RNA polymerase sigma factor [Gemmatimonadaceae bacterium]